MDSAFFCKVLYPVLQEGDARLKISNKGLWSTVFLMLLLTGLGSAQTRSYAILIVGDESNAEMIRQEKVLIQEMAKTVRKEGLEKKLPIFSYHFNKERERSYCEKRLNVLKEDLLFVGVVSLTDKVPRKVVYRIDRINNPSRAAGDVLARAGELTQEALAESSPTPSPSPTDTVEPSPSPSPDASTTPAAETGWRIQVGSFSQLKYAEERVAELEALGYEARVAETTDQEDPVFKVTIGPFEKRENVDKALEELKKNEFDAFAVEIEQAPTEN